MTSDTVLTTAEATSPTPDTTVARADETSPTTNATSTDATNATNPNATASSTDEGVGPALPAAAYGPSLPPVHECRSPDPAWIWCDDFEDGSLDGYFEYDSQNGSFVLAEGVGTRGSRGMRARFGEGQVNAGNLKLAFGRTPQDYFDAVDGGDEDYREIFWRVYIRHEEGWIGGGGDKLSRATIFSSPDTWAQAMIAHVWSGSEGRQNVLVLDPAAGTGPHGLVLTEGYNDFGHLRWLGNVAGGTPIFDPEHVGRWYCIEAHVRLNQPGRADGLFELWIDGRPEARTESLDWVGTYSDYGINAIFLENYWNAGSPATQERYFDGFVVSTERIGC